MIVYKNFDLYYLLVIQAAKQSSSPRYTQTLNKIEKNIKKLPNLKKFSNVPGLMY